jgi:phosphatidylglycerol---prolipoprotein diacylglyceryl transferase
MDYYKLSLDPIAFTFLFLPIRWYSLAYIFGILLGWSLIRYILTLHKIPPINKDELADLIFSITLGVVVGGRVGYILFYNLPFYINNFIELFKIWHGGMSFHGGLLGLLLAVYLFCRKNSKPFWQVMDLVAVATPIGLFFGRIANFINGELYGRATTIPWAVVFPNGGEIPRHPSQLYEAFFEGFVLFLILIFLVLKKDCLSKPRLLSGLFLIGYGSFRFFIEFFREPDEQLGLFTLGLSMGQILCLPMLFVGLVIFLKVLRAKI